MRGDTSGGSSREAGGGVTVVVGTRPEVIKLAPVVRGLAAVGLPTRVLLTGQHGEMARNLLLHLGVRPDADLGVLRSGSSLSALAGRLMLGLGADVAATRPAAVLVQGDTTSALCGALAAFYEGVPVGHVEAGLRSGRLDNPFPEEANRRLVARLARWHFAPTAGAAGNLAAEGVAAGDVLVTGNPVIDNLHWVLAQGLGRSAFPDAAADGRRVLVTLHRREAQGAVMAGLAGAVRRLTHRHGLQVLVPLHPNPRVREAIVPELENCPGVRLVEPLDYLDFTATLAACDLVLTDSGGVQEEAPALGKPVLVLRETTERPEAVDAGVACLVGTSPRALEEAVDALLEQPARFAWMSRSVSPFGDGTAALQIAQRLLADLPGAGRRP